MVVLVWAMGLINKVCCGQVGIDVSHHNHLTEEDWNVLQKEKNVSFVYAKFSEGSAYKDPTRFKYAKIAKERNLTFGGYHFFMDNVIASK